MEHRDFVLELDDSLHTGLIKLLVINEPQSAFITVFENGTPIPVLQSAHTFYFPYIADSSFSIFLNDEELDLPISSIKTPSLRNADRWISVLRPTLGKYGFQPIVFSYFERIGTEWKASNENVRFLPWMNMGNGYGHSSQFNVQPEQIDTLGINLYRGTVAFSMQGNWELKFIIDQDTLKRNIKVVQALSE